MAQSTLKYPLSRHARICYFLLLIATTCAQLHKTNLIYQFPNSTFVENLAVRPSGSILVTIATAPEVYLIQPSAGYPNPRLIHRFANATSVFGIVEVAPDSFIVAVSNTDGPGTPVPGSSKLYRITFPSQGSDQAEVRLAAKTPGILAPNGLVALSQHKILVADSAKGVIWVVNVVTGASSVAIQDPLFLPTVAFPIGVNGLKILDRTLYFTSSGQTVFGRVPVDLRTGAARGAASVVAKALPPARAYDDFALSEKGVAFVTNSAGNFIEMINVRSGKQSIFAGSTNSTEIAEPTSAAFGRNGHEDTLYITTAGGLFIPVNGDEIIGGQVVAVDLGKM